MYANERITGIYAYSKALEKASGNGPKEGEGGRKEGNERGERARERERKILVNHQIIRRSNFHGINGAFSVAERFTYYRLIQAKRINNTKNGAYA